jgi:hypothetical protein
VIDGQDNFIALSRDGTPAAPVPVLRLARDACRIPQKEESSMGASSAMKKVAAALAMTDDADNDDAIADLVVSKIKTLAAQSATLSKSAGEVTALAARVAAIEAEKTKAQGEVAALSKSLADRDAADCEREVAAVVALAASAGRPEAFDAEAQTYVRERWAKDRPAASRELARAKALAAATAPRGGKTEFRTAPVDKEAAAASAKSDFDAWKVQALGAGCRIEKQGDTVVAVRPSGARVPYRGATVTA